MQETPHDLTAFLNACARGDRQAQIAFQETYGTLIYNFPTRVYRLPQDDAGDFYLYVLDKDRIFKRARTFTGHQASHFEAYLAGYVLRDLFLEWRRTIAYVETVSLDAPLAGSEAGEGRTRTLQDILTTDAPAPVAALEASTADEDVERVLQQLDPEKRLVLKLLAFGPVDLEPDDIRVLAQVASRSIRETLACLAEVSATLATKALHVQEKWDTLHTVGHWIQTYQDEMAELEVQIRSSREQHETRALDTLARAKAEFERKLVWRYAQQAKLREELQRADVRPAYKDMASLLNVPVGTICSRLARAREALAQVWCMAKEEA